MIIVENAPYSTLNTIENQGNHDYDTQLTNTILNCQPDGEKIQDKYFRYYVKWEDIPSRFLTSTIKIDDDFIQAEIQTPPQNVAGTYVGAYSGNAALSQKRLYECYDYRYNSDTGHVESTIASGGANPVFKQYYNKYVIRKNTSYLNHQIRFMIFADNGNDSSRLTLSKKSSSVESFSHSEFLNFLLGEGELDFQSGSWSGYAPSSPFTVKFQGIRVNDFNEDGYYSEQRTINETTWTFYVFIADYYISLNRDRDFDGNLTAYSNPVPMLRIKDNNKYHFRSINSGAIIDPSFGTGVTHTPATNYIDIEADNFISGRSPLFMGEQYDGIAGAIGGLEFKISKQEIINSPQGKCFVNGNCFLYRMGSNSNYRVGIYRIYKPSEVLTHLILTNAFVKDTDIIQEPEEEFDFSSNKLIPHFDENDMFLNEWISGDFEEIVDQLRPWQYEPSEVEPFDPDDIPPYDPEPPGPEPPGPEPPGPEPPSGNKYKKAGILWEQLLYHIHHGIYNDSPQENHLGIRESDLEKFGKESLMKFISERADLDLNNPNKEDFFKIYLNTKIEDDDSHWNESIAKLADYYYKIFLTNELDNEKIADSDMTFGDLKNADAGYSFVSPPFVRPNSNGEKNYLEARGNDAIIRILQDISNLQFTQTQKFDEKINQYLRLIMPEYKRTVEIEDINRNFWVIGQSLTALFALIFDDDSIYPSLLSSILDEIIQLWENIFYLWLSFAVLSAKKPYEDIKVLFIPVIIEDINEEYYVMNDDIKFDNFSSKTQTVPNLIIKGDPVDEDKITDYNYRKLKELWNNSLKYYPAKYDNCALVLIPEIRDNNYMHNYYSRAIYPGVIFYDNSVYEEKDLPKYAPFKFPVIVNLSEEEQKIYFKKESTV